MFERFESQVDESGHSVIDTNREIIICRGLDREQSEYALLILNNGGFGDCDDDEYGMLVRAATERDAEGVFAAERPEWAF